MTLKKLTNFIRGKFVDPVEGSYLPSVNPATGELNAQVPESTSPDINEAVTAASDAFKSWSKTPRSVRSALLNKVADILESKLDEFALQESQDQGKPVSLAKSVDIPRAIHNFRFFASSILHSQEITTELDTVPAFNYVHRSPVGVAGLISPWNLPLYLLTWKIAPCIASGCTCVCKPSEMTSVTAFMLCEVLNEAGIPPGVVNMVFGTGPSAGAPLVSHPNVPLISFTGGTATGEIIYKLAAPLNKKLSLELGGKNANIIFEDADLDDAITTSIRSSFANQGEICLCGSRVFVQQSVYDTFVSRFVQLAEKLVVGDPKQAETNVGALVSEQHMNKVLSYIEIAKKEGGKILTGGERVLGALSAGYFVRPTVIVGVHPTESRVQKEEIFGPVVTISPFQTEEEVIKYANSTEYGLSASIWTTNIKRAHRVSHELHVGTAWVNCWMVRDLNMPFGGVKKSGLGREGRHHSMDFFCEEKTVCIKL